MICKIISNFVGVNLLLTHTVCVLWHPDLLFLKLRFTFWDAAVRGPHGQYSFQMPPPPPPDGRRPVLCISPGLLRGAWWSHVVHVRHPWAPQGAKSWGARLGSVRSPHGTRKVPCGPFKGFLRPNGQINTPGDLGAANSAPRSPYGL